MIGPGNDPAGVPGTLSVATTGTIGILKVAVDIIPTDKGDLRVGLFSPNNRSAVLHSRLGRSAGRLVIPYESDAGPGSPPAVFIGQPVWSDWVLRVTGLARRDVGTLNEWSLEATLV